MDRVDIANIAPYALRAVGSTNIRKPSVTV